MNLPASAPATMAKPTSAATRLVGALKVMAKFSIGQAAVQILTALTGLCLVRWLSIADYAQFGFSLTFQSAMGLTVDLGVTGAVIALVGDRYKNEAEVGRYMRAALYLRNRMLGTVCIIGASLFIYLSSRQGWPLQRELLILIIVLSGVLAQFWSSMYGVPLILHQRLGTYYGAQGGAAALRLICITGLYRAQHLGLAAALASGGIASISVAMIFKQQGRRYWTPGGRIEPEAKRNLLHYIAPLTPGIIFMAIQSQVTVLIVSYFGAAKPLAEVAALGRLTQVFTMLAAFNAIVLGPRFARLDPSRLRSIYLKTVVLAAAAATAAAATALIWPNSLLWLLGPKYSSLSGALRYTACAGCLGYVSSTLWSIHCARKWIYWWSTWYFIFILTAAQVFGVALVDVSTTIGASKLNLFSAIATLTVHLSVGAYSLKRQATKTSELYAAI